MKDFAAYIAALIVSIRISLADFLDPGRFAKLKTRVAVADYRAKLAREKAKLYEDAILRINQQARFGALPERRVVAVDRFRGGVERETTLTASAVRHVDLGATIDFDKAALSVTRNGEVVFRLAA